MKRRFEKKKKKLLHRKSMDCLKKFNRKEKRETNFIVLIISEKNIKNISVIFFHFSL